MERVAADFPKLLTCFRLETLEADPHSIYGLSADLAFNYFNPGWFTFARDNDGEPGISERFALGTHIGEAITGALRDFYLKNFSNILETGEVWRHDYECSSPDIYRIFHQTVYPLHNRRGLVIVNCLTKEAPHDPDARMPHPSISSLYTQSTGLITQCSNCRRVQRAAESEVWDWVPGWVRDMPHNMSHSICRLCYEYYYHFRYGAKG